MNPPLNPEQLEAKIWRGSAGTRAFLAALASELEEKQLAAANLSISHTPDAARVMVLTQHAAFIRKQIERINNLTP